MESSLAKYVKGRYDELKSEYTLPERIEAVRELYVWIQDLTDQEFNEYNKRNEGTT